MHHENYIPISAHQPLKLTLMERLELPDDHLAMSVLIVQGFRFDIVGSIANETALSENEILHALHLPYWNKVKQRKHRRFNTAESDRIYALIEVITNAEALFGGDLSEAIHWLKKPSRALGKRSPLENLNSFFEFQQVLSLIHRLERGVW